MSYVVAPQDVSEAIWVQIESEKILGSKFLSKDKFVKIINPGLNVLKDFKRLVLNDNSRVIPTARLKVLADLGLRTEMLRENLNFENIKEMLPNDVSEVGKSCLNFCLIQNAKILVRVNIHFKLSKLE